MSILVLFKVYSPGGVCGLERATAKHVVKSHLSITSGTRSVIRQSHSRDRPPVVDGVRRCNNYKCIGIGDPLSVADLRGGGGVRGGGQDPPTSMGQNPISRDPTSPGALFITNVISFLSLNFIILK